MSTYPALEPGRPLTTPIAILADIHGNLLALEAVLADLKEQAVDQVICLGDIVAFGPQPAATVRRLRELQWPTVMGNTDEWMLRPGDWTPRPGAERLKEILHWGREQLSGKDLDYLGSFAPTLRFDLGESGSLLCVHGSPRSNLEGMLSDTPADRLEEMLGDHRETVIAGGHTHRVMLRRFKETLLINPGTVGDGRRGTAEYAILAASGEGLSLTFRQVPYDGEAVDRLARESGMPHAEWWVKEWA